MDLPPIIQELAAAGLLDAQRVTGRPLTGGVSSDIWLLEDGQSKLVVKQALAQLRVAADWRADVGRNMVEHRYLKLVDKLVPGAVPAVRYVSQANHFFAMEYLGGDFAPWKQHLLAGEADPRKAQQAGELLGAIHAATWRDDNIRAAFDTTDWFDQLRLDPYLRATATAHPALHDQFMAEADRIANTRLSLVHGDFSPKNLMVAPGRLVVIDCEVAWFGDPTFDVAFLLNHMMLKALHRREHHAAMIDLARTAWDAYQRKLSTEQTEIVRSNLPRLLLMLMLARIDGKSPVEYLTEEGPRQRVRRFVTKQLSSTALPLQPLLSAWDDELKNP
ncbi:MAG: phosphotransferase [Phycisphaeraceae bacterium]|nr:phosphotransferase [Phycisphaeraceae bacterium]